MSSLTFPDGLAIVNMFTVVFMYCGSELEKTQSLVFSSTVLWVDSILPNSVS